MQRVNGLGKFVLKSVAPKAEVAKNTSQKFLHATNPKALTKDIFMPVSQHENAPWPDIYAFVSTEPFYAGLPDNKKIKPFYYISKLWSTGKGSGTRGIQKVVSDSVQNKETAGRVILDAACMDKKLSPAGFYYKLGFRFKEPQKNKVMRDWLKHGGQKKDAPMETGIMYLPKRNIEHCLSYGQKIS